MRRCTDRFCREGGGLAGRYKLETNLLRLARRWSATTGQKTACVAVTTPKKGTTKRKRTIKCGTPAEVEQAVEQACSFEPHKLSSACVCGVSYDKFRSGWTWKDAYEQLAWNQEHRPSQRQIVRHLAKLKRDEWFRHQEACAAPPETEELPDIDSAQFMDGLRGLRRLRRKRLTRRGY